MLLSLAFTLRQQQRCTLLALVMTWWLCVAATQPSSYAAHQRPRHCGLCLLFSHIRVSLPPVHFSFPPVFSLCAHVANHNSNNATQHLITLPLSLDTSTAKRSVPNTIYRVHAVLLVSIGNYSSVFFFFLFVCVSTSLKAHAPQGNLFFLYLVFFFLIFLNALRGLLRLFSLFFFFHPLFFFFLSWTITRFLLLFSSKQTKRLHIPTHTHTHTIIITISVRGSRTEGEREGGWHVEPIGALISTSFFFFSYHFSLRVYLLLLYASGEEKSKRSSSFFFPLLLFAFFFFDFSCSVLFFFISCT